MRSFSSLCPLALVALSLVGCAPPAPVAHQAPVPDSTQVQRARAAAGALASDLLGMLQRELAHGGPVAAIAVCSDSAQVRTGAHQQDGLSVRRVGTRVRNTADAPDSLEAAVLAAFDAAKLAGHLPPETVLVTASADGGHELRFLKPIVLGEPCLACHGPAEQLAPAVRQRLAERYPQDQATGYAVGDLRGAISVRLPLVAQPAH